jgi:ubiquinone/menaquinone biosynthesis C-methylase UbiE
MLQRILEPEVMNSAEDAQDYDAMDHSAVNKLFVEHLLAFSGPMTGQVLDVGTGTAQIPIALCQHATGVQVIALDAAEQMLKLAQSNIDRAGHSTRIIPTLTDAKQIPFPDQHFQATFSNSIIHHIPEPRSVFSEMVRVTASGGLLFVRDLFRPADLNTLNNLVNTYAAGANPHQRQLFWDSLHAALTVEEVQELVSSLGFARETVTATSDRHWTWAARRS